jgi:hypothetical protein
LKIASSTIPCPNHKARQVKVPGYPQVSRELKGAGSDVMVTNEGLCSQDPRIALDPSKREERQPGKLQLAQSMMLTRSKVPSLLLLSAEFSLLS